MNQQVQQTLLTFFSQFPCKTIKSGSIFLTQNEEPTGIYFLQQGIVRQFLTTEKNQEVITTLFKPHAFFPMPWALGIMKTNYSYKALTDVKVCIAPKEKVLAFLETEPVVVFDLLKRIVSGLDAVVTRMTYLMSGSAYERIVLELLFLAKRFGKTDDQSKIVTFKLVQSDLGNQTGLTRETVNREINKLKKQKLIAFERNALTIFSLQDLEQSLTK